MPANSRCRAIWKSGKLSSCCPHFNMRHMASIHVKLECLGLFKMQLRYKTILYLLICPNYFNTFVVLYMKRFSGITTEFRKLEYSKSNCTFHNASLSFLIVLLHHLYDLCVKAKTSQIRHLQHSIVWILQYLQDYQCTTLAMSYIWEYITSINFNCFSSGLYIF